MEATWFDNWILYWIISCLSDGIIRLIGYWLIGRLIARDGLANEMRLSKIMNQLRQWKLRNFFFLFYFVSFICNRKICILLSLCKIFNNSRIGTMYHVEWNLLLSTIAALMRDYQIHNHIELLKTLKHYGKITYILFFH